MIISPVRELTGDGSHTLRHPVVGDTYHSTHGAVTESEHIFIRNGFDSCTQPSDRPLRILEVGFGSGLNALLTLRAAVAEHRAVDYTAIELYPVDVEAARTLCYADDPQFMALHLSGWGEKEQIHPLFALKKIEADLADTQFDTTFDLVYFDAFAPDSQPELWTTDIFRTVFESMHNGGILVTYSAKGDVKRALREVGFEVGRLPGPPGKRHILRAVKP